MSSGVHDAPSRHHPKNTLLAPYDLEENPWSGERSVVRDGS
jgi:hypothetical protein